MSISTTKRVGPKSDKHLLIRLHQKLYPHFLKSTKENVRFRINETIFAIRSISETMSKFKIPHNFVNVATQNLSEFVHNSTKIDSSRCKNVPNTLEEYKIQSRNSLNRLKAQFLGDFVFAPIVFDCLFQFCVSRFNKENAIPMFIGAFIKLLKTKVVFAQTRPLPLIPYTIFLRSVVTNKFQDFCLKLFSYYGIDYKPPKRCGSCKSLCEYNIDCLLEVIKRCHLNEPIVFKTTTDGTKDIRIELTLSDANIQMQCVRVLTEWDCNGYPIVNAMHTNNMGEFLMQLRLEEQKLLDEQKEMNKAFLSLAQCVLQM